MSSRHEPDNATETSPLLADHVQDTENSRAFEPDESPAEVPQHEGRYDAPDFLSTKKLLMILPSIWVGVFLAALDGTIISTLSVPISASFNSMKLVSWVASAYFIANSALQPVSGRLTDIYGRRAGLLVADFFFLVGTALCASARSEKEMIAGRLVAGIGGGGIGAISTFITSDLVPLRSRGFWQGVNNIAFGCGAALGSFYGGWINDRWGWRLAFWTQIPFIMISMILAWFLIKIPRDESSNISRLKRIDFAGAFTLLLALVLFLLGLNSGGNIVPWSHPLVVITIPASFIVLAIFIHIEENIATEPIIPVKILLNRTVLAACLTNWFCSMSVLSLVVYIPIYYQFLGLSASEAGSRLIPQALGASVCSLLCGAYMRRTGRYYKISALSQALYITAIAVLATSIIFLQTPPASVMLVCIFFVGGGYSTMLTITLLSLISSVKRSEQAVVTSASYAFRSTGSSIGIAVASGLFQNFLALRLRQGFPTRPDIVSHLRNSLSYIHQLHDPQDKEIAKSAFSTALGTVWILSLFFGILSGTSSLFIREQKLAGPPVKNHAHGK